MLGVEQVPQATAACLFLELVQYGGMSCGPCSPLHCGSPPPAIWPQPSRLLLWRPEQLQGLHVAGSAFAMTEPEVASSDAGNISTSILRDGDDYVVNGNTWWISGAADERCTVFIVM